MSNASDFPVIPLKCFVYNKQKKTLQISRDLYGVPSEFYIESEKTGRVVHFVTDTDDMIANEHYDGEACSYKPALHEIECNIIRAFITSWD